MSARSSVLLALVLAACGGSESAPPATAASTSATASSANAAENASASGDATTPAEPPSPTPEGSATAQAATANEGPASSGRAPDARDPKDANAGNPPKAAPKQIGARHVLVQWMGADRAGPQVLRTREQALAIATDVQRRAKAGEDLGRLAVEYSDEPNAAARGGSLGRFGHGQMVPAFEAAAFKLEVGEISDVVETPFGFHVIQRTE